MTTKRKNDINNNKLMMDNEKDGYNDNKKKERH